MPVKNALYKLPDMFLALILSFSFVYALTSSLLLTYPAMSIFLLLFACLIVYSLMSINKISLIVSSSLIAAGAVVSLAMAVSSQGIGKCIAFVQDYFYWLDDYMNSSTDLISSFQLITVFTLCILTSLFVYIFTARKYLFLVLLAAGVSIFVVQWSFNMMMTLVPFYIFLLGILMAYIKYISLKKSKSVVNEYLHSGVYTLWLIPICVIIIFLASVINYSQKPMEWKWLDTKINSIYKYFDKQFDYQVFDYFSLSSSGFAGRDNILGGRVKLDNTQVLTVTTPRNVYLRGSIRDVYTGVKWTNSSSETEALGSNYADLLDDTYEMRAGMPLLTGSEDFLGKYFDKDKVAVRFVNLKTKSVFIPDKLASFTPSKAGINGVLDSNGSLSSKTRLDKGFTYSFEVYSPKLGTKDFEDALRKSSRNLYQDNYNKISSQLVDDYNKNPDNTSEAAKAAYSEGLLKLEGFQQLSQRANLLYQKYTNVPDSVPQRVRDLAASITAPCNNDYDKVKAIEKYLAENYPYNLDVKTTPHSRDFVDYFLFDQKQGYCSYYASAMTVLVRSIGIPARYVEGYILPPKPSKNDSKVFVVTNMQAHAWTEVYFEGYGWLTFEPTSPFRASYYGNDTLTSSVGTGYGSAYYDYMEMIKRYSHGGGIPYSDDYNYVAPKKVKPPYLLISTISIAALILMFLGLLVFNLFRSRLRLYKLFNREPRECILGLYEYYLRILKLQNLGIEPGETPYEYSKRVDGYMYFSPVKFKSITDIFVKSRYSTNDMSEKDKLVLCDFRKAFAAQTREYMGKFKYFLHRCILGRI